MKWQYATFTKFVVPVDVKISSFGKWIAYTIKRIIPEQNKTIKQIVLQQLQSGDKIYLSEETFKPKFSKDEKHLAYLKKLDKEVCLVVTELDHFTSKEVVKKESIVDFEWFEDNKHIALWTAKKRNDEDLYFEERLPVWFDGKGFLDNQIDVISIVNVENLQVVEEFFDRNIVKILCWKNSVVYTAADEKNPFTIFTIVQYSNSEKKEILKNVGLIACDVEGSKLVLYGRESKPELFLHDYVYMYENGKLICLTDKYGLNNTGHVSLEIWAADGESSPKISNGCVYFKSGCGGKVLLERISLQTLQKETLLDEGVVTTFDVSRNGKAVCVFVNDQNPAEVYLIDGKEIRKITQLNTDVASKLVFRKMNQFEYRSFDGMKIEGWYLKPDKTPAPCIVFVHGGPKGAYGYVPYFLGQLLIEEGFYVLYTNPRGSDNYSEEFALLVKERTGKEDFQDIMKAVEWIREHEQITDFGITGISYGGFMTNWAITQTDLFKAAVSENGISYWFTSYAFSDIGFWFDKSLIGEQPLENRNYRELSPIFFAKNVTTPILLIHSLEDYRCPLDQSLMFYTVLKDLGKEAYIAIFKKGAHSHSVQASYSHRLKRYKLIVEFFKQKLLEKKEKFDLDKALKD
ncbi:alpha/beta hydrolase family protein [Pseudothermotoga thermarum]|uniref:Acylaminoacyl-peptidase n=1 Tax=Pseudothermotoga thermarum DSM 5069 TaxID=688269 RepID=F7YXL2_9THEM|nr:S9 family peptidase [Pseudothermotoga thermarum]AEH50653.1 Acylaminoacyl-peptidase [Pseudothermotoga thermarum DSM 5069]